MFVLFTLMVGQFSSDMKVSCQTRRELLRVSVWQLFPDMRGDGSYQILRFFQWPPPQLPAATGVIRVVILSLLS